MKNFIPIEEQLAEVEKKYPISRKTNTGKIPCLTTEGTRGLLKEAFASVGRDISINYNV